MDVIAALTLGFMGSLHCMGMCGPIALAIPFSQKAMPRLLGVFLYNIGRVVTYCLLGVLSGLLGKGVSLTGFQQVVSIALGVVMILSILFPIVFKKVRFLEKAYSPINRFVKTKLSSLISGSSYSRLMLTGLLNGLLPCGLVYVALAGAIAGSAVTASVWQGVLFMALFGVGTIPMMAALPMLGSLGGIKFRNIYRKTLPIFVFTLGVVFILRGMNLGIKYISPKFDDGKIEMGQHSCH